VIVRETAEHQVEVASVDPVNAMERTGNPALAATAEDVRQRLTRAISAIGTVTAGNPRQVASFMKGDIEEAFSRIDENGDRSISFEEFAGLMREMDHAESDSALRVSFAAIDKDRDGRVSFAEFSAWVSR
jgi:hypothetical protein